MILLFFACTSEGPPSAVDSSGTAVDVPTQAILSWSTEPEPLVAGEAGQMVVEVTDEHGHPIEDLQSNHERLVHTMLISEDWTSFQHLHHEDFAELTVDNLKSGTLRFPVTLPLVGRYLAMFGYAWHNQWLYAEDFVEVAGAPAQAAAPDRTVNSEVEVDGMRVSLTWNSDAIAGYEALWTVSVETLDGAPVEDLVQYLGADAHCAVVREGLTWGSHTHAWFPGMDTMSPGMEMPHMYSGPTVDFAYTFPTGGTHKMWIQFARESAPGVVYVAPFVFEVLG